MTAARVDTSSGWSSPSGPVNSRARTSGTVPVDWTRRKYVRSPRKAPPGAVIPDRVSTVFVEPDEEVVERLAE